MDKLTRKELKTDKFAEEIGHSLEYVSAHRKQAILYGSAALALILAIAGGYYYTKSQRAARRADLAAALRIHDGVVGPSQGADDPRPTFASQDEKQNAQTKAFQEVVTKHPGTDAAAVAHFHLAASASDAGNLTEAARHFELAAAAGNKELASSANYSLAQVQTALGKTAEAEKLLRGLIASPTKLVSKEQATLELARVLGKSKPEEARKLVEPLQQDKNPVVARHATAVMGELPAK